MPKTFINVSGTFQELQRPYVKTSGVWQPIKKIWTKDGGTWKQVFGNTGSQVFSTVGTTSFIVPPGVYSISVTYPTPTVFVTTSISVTPSQVIPVTIGAYGSASTFGSVTMPAYDQQVFYWNGNVDNQLVQSVQMADPTTKTYSGSGSNSALQAGAAAAGLVFVVTDEGYHGDLGEYINMTPLISTTLVTTYELYYSYHSGREANYSVQTQPTSSNGYVASIAQYDGSRSEGYYENTLNIRQQGYFSITY